MSNHKSHMKSKAGRTSAGRDVYSGEDSNVVKEAKAKKSGGKVVGAVAGKKGRKRGGRVGCDMNPFSSARG